MNETLKYKYVKFPQIKLRLNAAPIGTMARRYTLPVIFTFFRSSKIVVKRAMSWVIIVANTRWTEVRIMG